MAKVLYRRGPDAQGLWSDRERGIFLGHRRLSIVDLSEHGRQPMISDDDRYVMSYNGEIYNCDELRDELGRKAESFRGHSDTEVVLAVIERFGLKAAATRFNGMFAMAIWDRHQRRLSLMRDRLGIKPLYYGHADDALLFSSQPSAMRQHPRFEPALSPEAVAAYLRASCVPSPLCIYRDAHQVVPGTMVHFEDSRATGTVECFWDPYETALRGQRETIGKDPQILVDELDALLTDSVQRRLVADVPLGAFLSGGIDSSTVVALMSKVSQQPVKTFTIGTRENSHDESSDARAIAHHLGTEHHELIATPEDALAVVEELPRYYDEPFADSSQIPTFLVSRLARKHVTVSLSGDGGDELFAGYNRHVWGPRVARINSLLPQVLRARMARGLESMRPETIERIYRRFVPHIGPLDIRLPADKAVKLARAISSASTGQMYQLLANGNADPAEVLHPDFYRSTLPPPVPDLGDVAHSFMFQDLIGYLPNDILTKVDRASMAVGLEARVPLLDHRVVEFAWSLPIGVKIAQGQGKWILRQVLSKYVPLKLVDRPKTGFGLPIAEWLRGPLRRWAESLLDPSRLAQEGLLDPAKVTARWEAHRDGKRDWSEHLWSLLQLESWIDQKR